MKEVYSFFTITFSKVVLVVRRMLLYCLRQDHHLRDKWLPPTLKERSWMVARRLQTYRDLSSPYCQVIKTKKTFLSTNFSLVPTPFCACCQILYILTDVKKSYRIVLNSVLFKIEIYVNIDTQVGVRSITMCFYTEKNLCFTTSSFLLLCTVRKESC